jgi:hypothetical protein
MDWWSAYSWCKGNGMEPVMGAIAGKSLTSDYVNENGNGSLYQYFGEDITFWTGHDKGDSCGAWYVTAFYSREYVDYNSRDNHSSALCQ